jgi:hypothetical protein
LDGQVVWVAAVLLYVYDSVSLRDRDAVLRYSIGGVSALLVTPSLVIARRRIFVPNPLRPDQCDLLLTSSRSEELSPVDRYFIYRASWLYLVSQIVSVGALLALFCATPLLATRMNLLYAIVITIGVTYWLCTFHWMEMWKNRHLLGIDGKTLRSDMLHVLLCPPNALNSARRIAALRHPRYGILSCLRAYSRLDAEKYEEQFQPARASA